MSITRDQLERMRRDLADAENQFQNDKAKRQRAVVGELSDINNEIKALVRKAEATAEAVGLKFYYSEGYDEFTWGDADTWNSSSARC